MSSTPRLVQRLGLALVATGLIAGAAVYASATSDLEADALAQQREMREVDRLGGTATVQTVKFNQWLASLWHGERLGWTLAVLGVVVGGACWRIGSLMGEEDLDE
jgi:ABC-type nitrate/sulfonate/bicarbonate transport system permease component